jgi:superfamily II RNA helicase
MYLDIVETDRVVTVNDPAITYPFPLDNFQKQAQFYIQQSENVLVTAHTSAGKTIVAESGIMFAKKREKKAFYTSPIKTLSNQKYAEFSKKFGDVGLLTGDIKCNPYAQCVVMTTEILRDMLFKNDQTFLDNLDCVIFDEVHYINNTERGHVWEECIIKLPANVTLVMLSATISDADKFADWIGIIKQKKIHLITTPCRPIPLNHYVYVNDELLLIYDKNNCFNTTNYQKYCDHYRQHMSQKEYLNKFTHFLVTRQLNPTIFFIFSRRKCESFANAVTATLNSQSEQQQIQMEFDAYLTKHTIDKKILDKLPQIIQMKKLVTNGVGFHHSGLLPILKEIVEFFFSKGYIKLLFATETFAVGVNMPTRTVVFIEVKKYCNSDDNLPRLLNPDEYLQMAGRAGRRGLDCHGNVIHLSLTKPCICSHMQDLLTGKSLSITSKFKINYAYVLKTLSSEHKDNIINVSFLSHQQNEIVQKFITDQETLLNGLDVIKQQIKSLGLVDHQIEIITEINQLETQLNQDKHRSTLIQKDIRHLKDKIYYSVNEEKLESAKTHINDIHDITEVLAQITNKINSCRTQLTSQLNQCITELYEMGYLFSITSLTHENLTMKGRIAAQITNANAILLTELIIQKKLNGLDKPSIAAILSVFCSDAVEPIDHMKILGSYGPIIQWVYELAKRLSTKYHVFATEFYEYGLTTTLSKIAYMWASGTTYGKLLPYLDTYDGDFVRNMLKLTQICDEVINICELCQDAALEKNIVDLKSSLMREVVTFDSLYLQKSD